MQARLFWDDGKYSPRPPLVGVQEAKYLIVGAGVGGLSVAYFLIRSGIRPRDIVIVERATVGSGSTGRSAGMLVAESETMDKLSWDEMALQHGVRATQVYREQLRAAQRMVRRLIRTAKIECDFSMQDLFMLGESEYGIKDLKRDVRRLRSFGERAHVLHGGYFARELAISGFTHAERTARGVSVNPVQFARGFASYLERKGVRIYEQSSLIKAQKGVAKLTRGSIQYGTIVYATGVALSDRSIQKFVTTIGLTQKLSTTTLRALKLDDLDMFIDEHGQHSFHYAKITGDKRLLLGYGDVLVEAHTSSVKLHQPHVRNIKRYLKTAFPNAPLDLEYAWSGVYALSKSNFPLVSVKKETIVLNGAGVQLGTVAAAEYAVAKHFGQAHPLDVVYQRRA